MNILVRALVYLIPGAFFLAIASQLSRLFERTEGTALFWIGFQLSMVIIGVVAIGLLALVALINKKVVVEHIVRVINGRSLALALAFAFAIQALVEAQVPWGIVLLLMAIFCILAMSLLVGGALGSFLIYLVGRIKQ